MITKPASGIFGLMVSIISLMGCNLQYNMLYYPNSYLPSAAELASAGLQFWPSGLVGYRGFIGANEIKDIKGTIIVFHGNAGTADDRAYYVATLGSIGYRVILAEYPGYGKREGELGEKSFVSDAQATVHLASEKYGRPVYLLGESLGCGVAAGLAGDRSLKMDGVILITPWDTLLSVSKSLFPLLPVGLFMKDKYDNVGNLKSYPKRIAVVGAQRDEIIPIRHAHELYGSLTGDKKMWVIQGAGHNDWQMFIDVPKWKEFMDFVSGDQSQGA